MATYKVNLSESNSNFDPLPVGEYLVNLDEYKEVESSGSKTEGMKMLKWTFVVREPSEHSGRYLWLNTLIEGENLYSLHNLLSATNLYTKEKLLSKSATVEPDKYVGLDFVAKVVHKDSGTPGEPWVNIKSLAPADTYKGSANSDW